MVYPRIDPVMLNDEDGYWLASYNSDKLAGGCHPSPYGSDTKTDVATKLLH